MVAFAFAPPGGRSLWVGPGAGVSASRPPSSRSASAVRPRPRRPGRPVVSPSAASGGGFGAGVAGASASARTRLDDHVAVDRLYPGLRQIHASPDVFVIDDFLTPEQCEDVIDAASKRDMSRSPVVYAGWTNDFGDVVSAAARGPALWLAVASMLSASASGSGPGLGVLAAGAGAYAASLALAALGAGAWVKVRESRLAEMRTSTSCALEGDTAGERAYVANAEALMPGSDHATFEAPTVIRYAPGQKLAPHFDANRGAEAEDAYRGGQTLATLLVYLNDVSEGSGGVTRFGRLGPLDVEPKRGRGLLFFPANRDGEFDERAEHEGTETTEEKWICRIWRHEKNVPPPYGLPTDWKP